MNAGMRTSGPEYQRVLGILQRAQIREQRPCKVFRTTGRDEAYFISAEAMHSQIRTHHCVASGCVVLTPTLRVIASGEPIELRDLEGSSERTPIELWALLRSTGQIVAPDDQQGAKQ